MRREVFLLVGSVLCAALLVEAGLRLSGWPWDYGAGIEQYVCRHDAVLGWRGIPHLRTAGSFEDGPFSVELNSNGYRDRDHARPKPPGARRVVMLGDSFVWGFYVRAEASVSRVLERMLGGSNEVISLGMPGYSTDQELLVLEGEGLAFDPDVVVLLLSVDDVFNNGSIATHEGKYPKPYYLLGENGALLLLNVPVPRLKSRVRLFEFVNSLRYKVKTRRHTPEAFRENNWLSVFTPQFLDSRHWKVTLRLLEEMDRECRSRNIRFLVAVIPLKEQLSSREGRLPQEVLVDFGRRTGIPVLDLLPFFDGLPERLYFQDDLHWNERGHLAAAGIIRDFLLRSGWVDRPGQEAAVP